MVSLILEGGTFRPIFSAGIMDALLDNNIMPDYCIGVSAGITNAFSYLSRQKKRNLEILESFRNDKRYLGARNFLKCRSLFGLDFVFDTIPNELNKFDEKAFSEYKGTVLVGVTNALTGKSEYLDGHNLDPKCTMLRATCAIPLVFPAISIDGIPYFDGGLADPIPIKKAIADGNTKHLIILTRPDSYRKTLSKSTKLAGKVLKKKYPNLVPLFLNRHNTYNQTVRFCEQLEKEGKAIILRPTIETQVESFEKDVDKLRLAYNNGYKLAISRMNDIKNLYK
ncbi:MAG: patatin-like phospholipase family protein [Clostridium sp.]|uniref:patatin-like phospholipase family protein n=1 Tax=Clostridium sp. TaxID=1506 RepID=UPI003EE4BC83